MVMRKTPFLRIRYPWTDDVVSVADIQSEAEDIDQALQQTASLAQNFSKMSSVVVRRAAAQSLTKSALTAISMDTVLLNNGASSPLANGSWFNAASPTRLTAPTACVVLASAYGGINFSSSPSSPAAFQVTIALNGATGGSGVQGSKYSPVSSITGQQWTSALSMWKLAAGDFLEMKMFWTGSPAGPFNTDTVVAPTLALMMVALPTVP